MNVINRQIVRLSLAFFIMLILAHIPPSFLRSWSVIIFSAGFGDADCSFARWRCWKRSPAMAGFTLVPVSAIRAHENCRADDGRSLYIGKTSSTDTSKISHCIDFRRCSYLIDYKTAGSGYRTACGGCWACCIVSGRSALATYCLVPWPLWQSLHRYYGIKCTLIKNNVL